MTVAPLSPRRLSQGRARLRFLAVALAVTAAFAGCASWAPPHAGEKIFRNVRYASPQNHDLAMDLYVPQTAAPAPVVVWIFGGSWRIGSKGYHVNLRDLTRHGIAVASIQYRLSGAAPYPAQLQDCEAALQWLRDHGTAYGLDPTRMGVAGESAGGHLAALVGMVEGLPRVRAVCALYPPANLVTLGRRYARPGRLSDIDRLLGGPVEQRLALAAAASPVNHVGPSSPPFLLVHGDRDDTVPLEQSEELHRQLRRAHRPSQLIVVRGQGHWFLLTPIQLEEVARFYRRAFGLRRESH